VIVKHATWTGNLKDLVLAYRRPHVVIDPTEGIVGPTGPQGERGLTGPVGPAGEGGDLEYVTVHKPVEIVVPNNALTTCSFSAAAEVIGTLDWFDTGSPSQLLVDETRPYLLHAAIQWDTNANGRRGLQITKNGTIIAHTRDSGVAGAAMGQEVSTVVPLTVGDVLAMQYIQTSGAALTINYTEYSPTFTAVKLWGIKGDPGTIIGMGTEFPASPSDGDLFILKDA